MKSFFKIVLGTMVGIVLLFLLLVLFAFLMDTKPSYTKNQVLHLELDGEIKEKSETPKFNEMIFYMQKPKPDLGQIIKALKYAKTDPKVEGVYIDVGIPLTGYSTANLLRKALEDFKTSGKFVYAYGEVFTPVSYYVSSVADSVFLSPNGIVAIRGFGRSIPFLKEFTDNLGIKWNIFYAGQFKSATEPLRLNKMSEQNRLQLHEFFNGLYKITSDTLIHSRELNRDSFEVFVDNFKGMFAANALKYGLVDSLMHQIDFDYFLKEKAGIKPKKKLKLMDVGKYARNFVKLKPVTKSKNKIAVLYMEGNIMDAGDKPGVISPEKFKKAFEDVLRKDKIKGVVVRVNSPGGSGSASDEILRSLDKIKEAGKPVIVSMGDYAASGGYYISCHADTIVADPNTLTGSIGVFGVFPDLSEMWDKKLKIHFDSVKTHKMALAFAPEYSMDEDTKKLLQKYIESFYEQFLNVVAKGRNMTRDQVHEVAQGRIWLGIKAKELGLVDVMGDLNKAIEICSEKAGVEKYSLVKYPKTKSNFLTLLAQSLSEESSLEEKILKSRYIRDFKPLLDVIQDESRIAKPQAAMPFAIKFD